MLIAGLISGLLWFIIQNKKKPEYTVKGHWSWKKYKRERWPNFGLHIIFAIVLTISMPKFVDKLDEGTKMMVEMFGSYIYGLFADKIFEKLMLNKTQ